MLTALIHNAALLLAMMVVFDLVTSRRSARGRTGLPALTGLSLGGLCIGIMLTSVRLEAGIIFDTRSVLLSLAGLFFGAVPTAIAMATAATYRLWLGGPGVWMGIPVIVATGGIGLLWRHYRQGRLDDISVRELYGFGVVVHLVMLALALALPGDATGRVLAGIAVPVLLVYPLATVALGWLLSARLRRERAAAALAVSEARYRSLSAEARLAHQKLQRFVDANIVGVVVASPSGDVLEANDYYLRMVGHTREEFERGLVDWRSLTPPEWLSADENAIKELRERGTCTPYEKQYLRRDGTRVSVFLSDVMLPGSEEIVAFVLDITERKRAEEAQREAHDRLTKIVATVPGIVCSFRLRPDGSACYPYGGERLAQYFGIPQARLVEDAGPFLALVHPDDLDEVMASIRESGRQLRPFRGEWRVRHPVHGELWMEVHSMPAREPDGSTLWQGVATDITERKQADAALTTQLAELQRWYKATLGREHRVRELKREVNELLDNAGVPPRYTAVSQDDEE